MNFEGMTVEISEGTNDLFSESKQELLQEEFVPPNDTCVYGSGLLNDQCPFEPDDSVSDTMSRERSLSGDQQD